jgi:hypothetical protein
MFPSKIPINHLLRCNSEHLLIPAESDARVKEDLES